MPIEAQDSDHIYRKRVKFWNRIYRTSLILLVALAVSIQISSNIKINSTAQAIKKQQELTDAATKEARKANIARQQGIEDYIKCLSILRFDVPAEELKTREGAIKALDSCANKD